LKNKVFFIILSLLVILITILFLKLRKQVIFSLNGDSLLTISYGESFNDPLFNAKNGYGKDLSSYVRIDNNIDFTKSGAYTITYTLDYLDYHSSLIRVVVVKSDGNYTLVLNGDEKEYALLGSNYEEKGAYVINNKNDEKININNIISNVDTKKIGEYQVKYVYEDKEILRKVVVFDIPYTVQKNGLNVEISLDVNVVPNYFNTRLPNDKYSYDKNIKYIVNKNGIYSFKVYDYYKGEYEKIIEVNDIIKDISCIGNINYDGTFLELKGDSKNEVTKVKWNINNKEIEGSTSLKVFNIVNNAYALVTYNNDDAHTISCSINDNLAYHFKYDINNTKPFMTCNSYTSSDKVLLDSKLALAISEAGYGTRAGVVEAARFIVGALDYKIPYLGPKKENYSLGRYPYVGLNIGSNTSWGCSLSGYIQGIDCTNFVNWAFVQNGLTLENVYGTTNTYKTRSVVNELKVGDLLLTPCEEECISAFTHVGIIIGIDDSNIYVAEATTGNIDATVVTKWNKYNMPQNGKFSIARLYKYDREGNITNMWLS